jgi:hypothetical protein
MAFFPNPRCTLADLRPSRCDKGTGRPVAPSPSLLAPHAFPYRLYHSAPVVPHHPIGQVATDHTHRPDLHRLLACHPRYPLPVRPSCRALFLPLTARRGGIHTCTPLARPVIRPPHCARLYKWQASCPPRPQPVVFPSTISRAGASPVSPVHGSYRLPHWPLLFPREQVEKVPEELEQLLKPPVLPHLHRSRRALCCTAVIFPLR